MSEFNEGYWVFIFKNFFSNTESIDGLAKRILTHRSFNNVISVWFVLLIQETEENNLVKYILLGGRVAEMGRKIVPEINLMVKSLLIWSFFAISRRNLSICVIMRIKRLLRLWEVNNSFGFKWSQTMMTAFAGIYPRFSDLIDVNLQLNSGNIWNAYPNGKDGTKASILIEKTNENGKAYVIEADRPETTQTIVRNSNALTTIRSSNGLVVTNFKIRTVFMKILQPIFLLPGPLNLYRQVYVVDQSTSIQKVYSEYGTGNSIADYDSSDDSSDTNNDNNDNHCHDSNNNNNNMALMVYTGNDRDKENVSNETLKRFKVDNQSLGGVTHPLKTSKSSGKNMKTIMEAYEAQKQTQNLTELHSFEDDDNEEVPTKRFKK